MDKPVLKQVIVDSWILKVKISPNNVARQVMVGSGKCPLLGMRQQPAIAVQRHSWLGSGVNHGKQQEHEERKQMLTQKQTFC